MTLHNLLGKGLSREPTDMRRKFAVFSSKSIQSCAMRESLALVSIVVLASSGVYWPNAYSFLSLLPK